MAFTDEQLLALRDVVKGAMFDVTRELDVKLQDTRDEVVAINARLVQGDERMTEIAEDLAANSSSTEEMRGMFDTAKKGFVFFGWIGSAAKFLLKFAAPIFALYALVNGNHHTPK